MTRRQHKKPTTKRNVQPIGWMIAGVTVIAVAIALALHQSGSPGPSDSAAPGIAPTATRSFSPVIPDETEAHARYAGSASCIDCHSAKLQEWQQSNHAMAEREPSDASDLDAFVPERSFTHGSQATEVRKEGDRFLVATDGLEGRQEYEVERVIGHDPLRQFLVDVGNGRLQTLEASYDPHNSEWFNVYGDEDRQPGEWGHWTGRGMNWNAMCASCHNTRLRKNYDEPTDSYHTTMAERTVSCEACHGPKQDHVLAYRAGTVPEPSQSMDRVQVMQTCATCHSRRGELTGDFVPGDNYFDHYHLTVPDMSDQYYPDGQVRDENYVFGSFVGSKMHAAGVTCLDCHDPHTTKLILPGNDLCMRCHSGGYPNSPIINPTAHSFHAADSPGNQCVSCHMPQTTYMQRHPRRDHGFTIPDPLLTRELGIPNACNRCHSDQSTEWAIEAVEQNYGGRMQRPTRERARWIAKARQGDPTAKPEILAMLSDDPLPYWRAVAANLLNQWLADSQVQSALLNAVSSSNDLVRSHAARAAEPLAAAQLPAAETALRPALDDPVRSVRINAAWSLRNNLDATRLAARELEHFLRINADQPGGQLQLGNWLLAQNQPAEALRHFEKAVAWEPNSAALRHELAVVYSLLNRPEEAVASLQEAVRLEPEQAEFHYRLALGWNEIGDLNRTIQSLEEAVRLEPTHARAWYNLGLARNATGETDTAIDALLRAETADPNDPRIPYARATILAQLGRLVEARTAAERALTIEPDYPPARGLLNSLR